MPSGGAVLCGIWRCLSIVFWWKKKNQEERGKKIEENKNSLYKYTEGWGTSFCCLSKLCLPIYCHVNSVMFVFWLKTGPQCLRYFYAFLFDVRNLIFR